MYIDTLTRIRNAQQAGKQTVRIPFTKMDVAIVELLARASYIKEVSKKGRGVKRYLLLTLQTPDKQINEITVISKPSRRVYRGYDEIRPVKSGLGMAVLSTSNGILSGVEARKQKCGGELLFMVW